MVEARPGMESMLVYNDTLLISQFNKIEAWEQKNNKMSTGAIFVFVDSQFIELKTDLIGIEFRPFGMSIYKDKLFVINEGYGGGGEALLIFKIKPNWDLELVN